MGCMAFQRGHFDLAVSLDFVLQNCMLYQSPITALHSPTDLLTSLSLDCHRYSINPVSGSGFLRFLPSRYYSADSGTVFSHRANGRLIGHQCLSGVSYRQLAI